MQELKEEIKNFWNNNPCGGEGKYQDRFNWLKEREEYAFKILNKDLVEGKKCLDVGCGQGFSANYIANWAKEVIGIDISDKSIFIAKEGRKELNKNNVTYQIGDAEELRFENDSFDIVYSMGVLHHTPNTQKGIDEIYRVVKPKGTVIVMLYRKYSPKGLAVLLIRKISALIDKILRKKYFLDSQLQLYYSKRQRRNHGTALNELFGCPILKMYSKKEIIKMFYQFKEIKLKFKMLSTRN